MGKPRGLRCRTLFVGVGQGSRTPTERSVASPSPSLSCCDTEVLSGQNRSGCVRDRPATGIATDGNGKRRSGVHFMKTHNGTIRSVLTVHFAHISHLSNKKRITPKSFSVDIQLQQRTPPPVMCFNQLFKMETKAKERIREFKKKINKEHAQTVEGKRQRAGSDGVTVRGGIEVAGAGFRTVFVSGVGILSASIPVGISQGYRDPRFSREDFRVGGEKGLINYSRGQTACRALRTAAEHATSQKRLFEKTPVRFRSRRRRGGKHSPHQRPRTRVRDPAGRLRRTLRDTATTGKTSVADGGHRFGARETFLLSPANAGLFFRAVCSGISFLETRVRRV